MCTWYDKYWRSHNGILFTSRIPTKIYNWVITLLDRYNISDTDNTKTSSHKLGDNSLVYYQLQPPRTPHPFPNSWVELKFDHHIWYSASCYPENLNHLEAKKAKLTQMFNLYYTKNYCPEGLTKCKHYQICYSIG